MDTKKAARTKPQSTECPDAIKTPAVPPPADRALSHELCLYSQHVAQAWRGLCDPRLRLLHPRSAFCSTCLMVLVRLELGHR